MEAFNKTENINGRVNMSGYLNEQEGKKNKTRHSLPAAKMLLLACRGHVDLRKNTSLHFDQEVKQWTVDAEMCQSVLIKVFMTMSW